MFMKARTVPFAIRDRYERALDKLEEDGIIEKVEFFLNGRHLQFP